MGSCSGCYGQCAYLSNVWTWPLALSHHLRASTLGLPPSIHPLSRLLSGEERHFSWSWELIPTAVSARQARYAQTRKPPGIHTIGIPGSMRGYILGHTSQVERSPGHGAAPAPGSPSSSSSSQELLPWQPEGPPTLCQQDDAKRTSPHGVSFSPHPGLV